MKSRERSANRQSVASRSISGWNCCLLPNGELSDLLVEIKVPRENTRGAGLTDAYLCQLQLTMACTLAEPLIFFCFTTSQACSCGVKVGRHVLRSTR